MRELHPLLRELDPPAGGLQRLRQAIDARDVPARPRLPYWIGLALTCSTLAAVWLVITLPDLLARHRHIEALQHAMQLAITPGNDGVRIRDGAVLELPSGQANARLYLVQWEASSSQAR